jgi:transcriptional regulator with XRE-family HTH domain
VTATEELAALSGGERGQDDDSEETGAFARQLGGWLRFYRELRGLSLPQLGRQLGAPQGWQALRSYEDGSRAIKPETLSALAAFYGVDVADFLPEYGPVPPRLQDLPLNQRKLLSVLGQHDGPFTLDELTAALPTRSPQGIRRAAVSLRNLGLVIAPIAAGPMYFGLTRAGRRVLERT